MTMTASNGEMKHDIDTYREIFDTLTRNKSRSLLTGFGIFWGVFMLILLIGGGSALKEMMQSNFAGFATNTAIISAQPTTKVYKGFAKGRIWRMTYQDVERLKRNVPGLDLVVPIIYGGSDAVIKDDRTTSCIMHGTTPDYAGINEMKLRYGRFLNRMDMEMGRKVCVVGSKIYNDLFPNGTDPCGQSLQIDSICYEVVGVDGRGAENSHVSATADMQILVPLTVMQKAYNSGNSVDQIAVTARSGLMMSAMTADIRAVIARAHLIDPDDEQGISVFNIEVLYQMMDNLFSALNMMIWLVGIGTLLAGAIGVSNIMMVTVRERTVEIGIRRAIGATPGSIMWQIITESMVMTALAGMSGILVAVTLLQMLEMTMGGSMPGAPTFQVDFNTAIVAAMLLCMLGGLAGLAPAWRAMNIKPVDAMRDE